MIEPSDNYCITATRLDGDFLPDADLSKPIWHNCERVSLVDTVNPARAFLESQTHASVRWSPDYLYVAFWCHYVELNTYLREDPQRERWELWKRDVVEVFINPFPATGWRYWEFEVAPNNQWIDLQIENRDTMLTDAAWNSGFDHSTFIDEPARVWTCEMRLPVVSMNVNRIEPGQEWRINFYRCDGPGNDRQRRFLAWSPTCELNFHVPERFGWIRMQG